MSIKKVNLAQKFNSFYEHWSPKIIGELNGQMVKIAKVKGDFVTNETKIFVENPQTLEMSFFVKEF